MDNKKYLSLEGLRVYDGLIKQELENHTHSYNDLTDRTHYKTVSTESIIDEMTITGVWNDLYETINPTPPSKIIVIFDNTKYELLVFKTEDNTISWGDSRLYNSDTTNPIDVPFFIMWNLNSDGLGFGGETYLWSICLNSEIANTSHTVKIEVETGEVEYHTLDENFIPDTIARKSDLSSITVSKAEEATHAETADSATTAATATKASQDSEGNVITDTYETKEDAQAKYDELNGAKANAGHTHSYNDLTDRTHWVEQATDVLLEEQSVTGEEQDWMDGYYYYIEGLDTVAYCGEQYIITVDGVSYNCESYVTMYGENAIGDSRLSNYIDEEGTLNTEHPEDVPFHIQTYYYSEESWELINDWCEWEISFATAGTHTVKIERINPNETTYNTLDENFIPDTIARKSYVDSLHIKYDKLESTEWSSAHRVSKYRASIPSVTSLTTGTLITVLVYEACASNATLNVNGLGEKPIYYRAEPIKELAFPTNTMVALVYSTDYPVTTGAWHCIYTPGGSSSNVDLSTYETKEDAQTKYNTITEAKADWNQNDENAIDYVKNRTHWVENGGVVILPECQPPYDENEGAFVIPGSVPLESGKTVTLTVNWNGTEYECKTYWMSMDAENDTVICGNSAVMLEMWGITAEENECPFIIGAMPGMGMCMFLPLDGSTTLTVSIYQGGEVVHHLDPKYIKDMYYTEQIPVTGLPETTRENVSSPVQIPTALPITGGANYTVMWNGTPYECVATETSSGDYTYKYMGNGYLGRTFTGTTSEDTGEPFFILTALSANENMTLIIFNDGSTTVTLSYEGVVNIIHKIDAKYLPEMPNTGVTYTLSKSGSTITLTGSDGSETSVTDSDTVKTYSLSSFGVTASSSEINKLDGVTATTEELNILSGLTTTTTELNRLDGLTATASELNKLDGVTATTEELNYVAGVTSPIQTQINNKPGKQGTGYRAEIFNDYTGNISSSEYSHAEGSGTTASAAQAHAEGHKTTASGNSSHAEGRNTTASGLYSHAEGCAYSTTIEFTGAAGATTYQVAGSNIDDMYLIGARVMVTDNHNNNPKIITVNNDTVTLDKTISSEGAISSVSYNVKKGEASGDYSHAEGYKTIASGYYSHAEGDGTIASGTRSHAEGGDTTASGGMSHAEGTDTTASGNHSHAEGYNTTASGETTHAEGHNTIASGRFSHAEGYYTIAAGDYQHVQGMHNVEASDRYAHIVGNGSSDKRSNAHTLDWNGNAWYAGAIKVGGTSYDDASEVALKSDLDSIELISLADIDVICGTSIQSISEVTY